MKQEIPIGSEIFYESDIKNDIIRVTSSEDVPSEFVKFYALNNNSVDALLNTYLYASHPFDLNDPYDCYRWFQIINSDENDTYWLFLYSKIGLVSLSHKNNWNNLLMWGHYSNHEGFNLLLDPNDFCFDFYGPFPMNYTEKIPEDIEFKDVVIEFAYYATAKFKNWKYENEWRIFPKSKGMLKSPKVQENMFPDTKFLERKFHYKLSAIKEIVLGYKFIFNENCYFQDKKDKSILLKTNSELKLKLLSFILENKINLSIIFLDNIYHFGLGKANADIEKLDGNTFKFYIKEKYVG